VQKWLESDQLLAFLPSLVGVFEATIALKLTYRIDDGSDQSDSFTKAS
jgi:hypothetical protein